MLRSNAKGVDYSKQYENSVRGSVAHLHDQMGLAWFGCERFYNNGDLFVLTTDTTVYSHHLRAGIPLRQYPPTKQVLNNVFEDILVPQANTTGRHMEEIKMFGHGCQAVFIIYRESCYDVLRFSTRQAAPLAINALIKSWDILERTICDFFEEYDDLLGSVDGLFKTEDSLAENHYRPSGKIAIDYKSDQRIELPASELRVLSHYGDDKTHKHIATELGITSNTSETYLERVRQKTGVGSRKKLKGIARANKLRLGFNKLSGKSGKMT